MGIAKYASFWSILHILFPGNNISFNRNNPSILKCWYGRFQFRSFRLTTGRFSPSFFFTRNKELRNWFSLGLPNDDVGLLPRLDKIFLGNLHITYSSVCIVRAIKEQEEVRVMTSSFSDKGRAAVLDQPAEISRSETSFLP